MAHCSAMICQSVTLSGDAEWPKVADAVIKALKILEDLQAGQKALQEDMTAVKRLDHHGKLLTGLTASMATVLEEQQSQRSDIRSLHTEVHASREELKGEIRAARDEAKQDNRD
jgi:hypothetical protein